MSGVGVFGWVAGALQLIVPSYAFRLVRRFGTSRVGWFVVTAFGCLALMHLLAPFKPAGAGAAAGITLDLLYVAGCVLLLSGMGHLETLYLERDRAHWTEQKLRKEWESRLNEEMSDLVAARQSLLQELAHREEVTKALEESEARYRSLFVDNPQPMWILELRSCRFLAVNNAALRQYGFSQEEFMALTGRDLLLPATVAQFLQDAAKPCAGIENRGIWQHCKKDGTLIDVEISAADLQYAGAPARLILAQDVTQRRRREMKQRKVQRMEAVSQLAAGVAHHFNDLLTLIEDNALAMREKPLDLQSSERLEHINTAVSRAAGITRQLLAAGGRQLIRPEPLDLNGLIRNSGPMLRRLVGEHIKLHHSAARHLPPVLADRHQLEQIIVYLALNAREAMPGGGTLSFTTAKIHVEEDLAQSDPLVRAGDFVRLEVRDTGCGMSPQVQSRLFEPFFTTRGPGEGLGLGLASVYGIIHQHSGWIEVISELGAGTEVRIYLPFAPGSFSVPDTDTRSTTSLVKGTILLVEPDDRGRALARFVLNRHGYRVIEADSSATALVLWPGQAPMVDLLLTSVGLPSGLSGRELADRLRQSRPDLKVLYSSDQELSSHDHAPALLEGSEVIRKPYQPDNLVKTIRGCLGV